MPGQYRSGLEFGLGLGSGLGFCFGLGLTLQWLFKLYKNELYYLFWLLVYVYWPSLLFGFYFAIKDDLFPEQLIVVEENDLLMEKDKKELNESWWLLLFLFLACIPFFVFGVYHLFLDPIIWSRYHRSIFTLFIFLFLSVVLAFDRFLRKKYSPPFSWAKNWYVVFNYYVGGWLGWLLGFVFELSLSS